MFPDAIYKDPIQPATPLLEPKNSLISTYSMEKPTNMVPTMKQVKKDEQTTTQLYPRSSLSCIKTSVSTVFPLSSTAGLLGSKPSACLQSSAVLVVFSEPTASTAWLLPLCTSTMQSFILWHSYPCNFSVKSDTDDDILLWQQQKNQLLKLIN